MRVEIIKEEPREYKAGDILSIGNPYETNNYLLYENNHERLIWLIDLSDGTVFREVTNKGGFDSILASAINRIDGHEYKVFNSESEVKLILGK